jgi:hypothetical protein
MDGIKEWTKELALDTIVATVVTLLVYIIGIIAGAKTSWDDAAQTFIMSFLIMFVLGVYRKIKKQ